MISLVPIPSVSGGPLTRVLAARRRLPENVRALGWISLANDSASELAYPILPLFLTITLGAPLIVVGLVEGVPEAVSTVVKLLSGWLSDLVGGRRRPWIAVGYVLSSIARVLTAVAGTWQAVLGARVVDRVGKGARGTPRDALIRDSSPPELVGASFGYHRAMDTAGAVFGPLLAVVLLESNMSLRSILWVRSCAWVCDAPPSAWDPRSAACTGVDARRVAAPSLANRALPDPPYSARRRNLDRVLPRQLERPLPAQGPRSRARPDLRRPRLCGLQPRLQQRLVAPRRSV